MRVKEFVKRVKRLDPESCVDVTRGKGGHITIFANGHRSVLPALDKDIQQGVICEALRRLRIEKKDFVQ